MKNFFLHVSYFVLAIISQMSWAQSLCNGPNLLSNPSFELPVVPNGGGANNIVASVPGWTNRSTTTTSVNVVKPTGTPGQGGPTTAHHGDQYIDLQGDLAIMDQTITLPEAAQLAFSGNFANRGASLPAYAGGAIGIQILNTDLTIEYGSESNVLNAALGNNTWITISGLTSVLPAGNYVFRFYALTDYAHFDDFSLCYSSNAALACANRTVLKPQPGWTATASSSFNPSMQPGRAIDGSTRDAGAVETDTWSAGAGTGAGEHITFDYGSALNLVGIVYYPRTLVRQDIRRYTVQSSNDGTIFTDIQSGMFTLQNSFVGPGPTTILIGNPIEVNFVQPVSARYLRLVIRSAINDGTGGIAELLPIVCNTPSLQDISCINADLLNTGTDGTGNSLGTLDKFDNHWEVAFIPNQNASYVNNLPPLSVVDNATYVPAIITGNKIPGTWANSPFGNAQWISYTQTSRDANTTGIADGTSQNTYFFRYRFNLSDPYLLPAFKLKLNFLADNVTKNIYINGTGVAPQFNLPGGGFALVNQTQTSLSQNWQIGQNEIIVQLYSQPSLAGFLGQNITSCPGIDFGDAPASFNVSRTTFGAGHIVETDQLGTVTLKLGNLVDAEADGIASTGMSDNNTGENDEDGVSAFPQIPGGVNPAITNYTVNVAVSNVTGLTANLCGWIDWNNNGVFDVSEAACTTVPNNATTAQLVWASAVYIGTNGGTTYARFRITTDALSSPNGAASNGEVEDYFVNLVPLPVKLYAFEVNKQENQAALTWMTTEETQSDRFEVEHSLNGTSWNLIATVKSNGESTTQQRYSFVDIAPAKGNNLYRLKMIDNDGTYAYSRIRNIDFNGIEASVYPNPAADKLYIQNYESVRNITFVNISGKKVLISNKASANGLDISTLPAGMYLVTVLRENGSKTSTRVLITK
jgi:hypothetical protein